MKMSNEPRHILLARIGLNALIIAAIAGVLGVADVGLAQSQRGKRTLRMDAIKVEGRVHKPQAFYILQRSSLNFAGMAQKRSFIDRLYRSIEQAPF